MKALKSPWQRLFSVSSKCSSSFFCKLFSTSRSSGQDEQQLSVRQRNLIKLGKKQKTSQQRPFYREDLPPETLFVMDGTSLFHVAFHVANETDEASCRGLEIFAVNFAHLIKLLKPKYLAVAFDSKRDDCFRRELYSLYKMNRSEVNILLCNDVSVIVLFYTLWIS